MKISADQLERLFSAPPDVVFFVKGSAGHYGHANLIPIHRNVTSNTRAVVVAR